MKSESNKRYRRCKVTPSDGEKAIGFTIEIDMEEFKLTTQKIVQKPK